MACRREGISPFVLARPGRPARSGSVTLHSHGFGSEDGRSRSGGRHHHGHFRLPMLDNALKALMPN
jgi:hypothetical protein